jgi:hypothetical protein
MPGGGGVGAQWLRGRRDPNWPLGAGTQWCYRARLGTQGLGTPPGAGIQLRPQLQGSLLVLDIGILNHSQRPLLSLEAVEAPVTSTMLTASGVTMMYNRRGSPGS